MHAHEKILDRKTYALAALAVVSFSHCVVTWFGRTMPGVVVDFFKGVGEYVVLTAAVIFILAWLLRARPHDVPKSYHVVPFDVFGKRGTIDGIRTEFKTHDVAWSFMKQYRESYPLYHFALVSGGTEGSRQTIFKYL